MAIQTLSEAYTASKQGQEQEQFYFPPIPVPPLPPRPVPHFPSQQGYRYCYGPNIATPTPDLASHLNLPMTPLSATAAVSVPGQAQAQTNPYNHNDSKSVQLLLSFNELQNSQDSYLQFIHQQQQPNTASAVWI